MLNKTLLSLLFVLSLHYVQAGKKDVVILTEDNWHDMLEGEWMVKFYAPWCPACRAMEDDWKQFATWQEDLDFNCAEIDVTEHPAVGGRFFVTSLPTIYHVKNGVFGKYTGRRDEESLQQFIEDKDEKDVTEVPWYTNPTSLHMAAIGHFFKLSLAIRDLHERMTTEFGIPVWGSYVAFAVMTIVVGLFIGLGCVCICDCCCPVSAPPERRKEPLRYTRAPGHGAPLKDEDEDSDNIHDDREHKAEDTATGGDCRPKQTRKRTVQKD